MSTPSWLDEPLAGFRFQLFFFCLLRPALVQARPIHNVVRVCVKASPAEGRFRFLFKKDTEKTVVTKSRENLTRVMWVPHHLCDTMSRTAPMVPPTKLQKRPHMLWPTCGSSGAPTQEPLATSTGGTSRALANANCQNTSTASSLHRPPVSRATTTNLHRSDPTSSGYVAS